MKRVQFSLLPFASVGCLFQVCIQLPQSCLAYNPVLEEEVNATYTVATAIIK